MSTPTTLGGGGGGGGGHVTGNEEASVSSANRATIANCWLTPYSQVLTVCQLYTVGIGRVALKHSPCTQIGEVEGVSQGS